MGFFADKLLGELRAEFIARPDASKDQIVYKWPNQTIRKLSQLTVEADETAVFFRDGKVAGTFPPGRYTLDSTQIPFLGILVDAATGGNLFKTEVYFVGAREFTNLPFGGSIDNVLDPETSLAVGLRVFGDYSLKVVDAGALIVNLVGSQNLSNNDEITGWMREMVLKSLRQEVVTQVVAGKWPILGIATHTADIEQATLASVQQNVAPYGVAIARMGNFTVSLGDDDAATLKNYRRDVSYTKLAGSFTQYGAGEALRGIGEGAAKGDGAGNAALLGLGVGLSNVFAGAANAPPASAAPAAPAPPQAPGATCPQCGTVAAPGAKFCGSCGAALAPAPLHCSACGAGSAGGRQILRDVRDEALTPSLVIARGGGGGHGGGGHGGGGHGGGWGGGSAGGGWHASSGYHPGYSSGFPVSLTLLVLLLVVGTIVCFVFAFWALRSFVRGPALPPPEADFPGDGQPPAAPPQRALRNGAAAVSVAALDSTLAAIRSPDPAFELETFLQRAEMTFYLVKAAFEKGEAAAGRPYLAPPLFARWSGEIGQLQAGGKRILFESLNVRGLTLANAGHDDSGDTLAVHIDAVARTKVFDAAGTLVADDGDDVRFGELWHFGRAAGLRTLDSGGVVAQKCPSCGAPLTLEESGACKHCGNVVNAGRFDWTVTGVERTMFWGGATGALDGAEVLAPAAGFAALHAADAAFDERAFLERVRNTFFALQQAWEARDVDTARTYLSPGCYFGWRSQLERMIADRRRNVLEGLRVDAVTPVKVVHGRAFDELTVRVDATCADYESDERSGAIVFGDRTPRPFTEYWTFQRGVAAKSGAPGVAEKKCPNCGAPLALNQIGQCTYCGAAVMSGQFDWVLSRIEEAEEYAAVAG